MDREEDEDEEGDLQPAKSTHACKKPAGFILFLGFLYEMAYMTIVTL